MTIIKPNRGTTRGSATLGSAELRGVNEMQPYVGQIIAVGFNFAPVGWLLCNGQLLPISQYDVLYNLIGTTYGGDGQNTFALPNLCGRSPINQGTGSGLTTRIIGEAAGSENVTLTGAQIAAHSHPLLAASATGTISKPSPSTVLTVQSNVAIDMYHAAPGNVTLASTAVGGAGNNLPHENRQPFNTVNYIIAFEGVYPSQN